MLGYFICFLVGEFTYFTMSNNNTLRVGGVSVAGLD